ncbi:MAG: EmrA/EmrK family multidrug efflux transporter periplasmic adaptor subunit, partial [Herbaspirillum sp.]
MTTPNSNQTSPEPIAATASATTSNPPAPSKRRRLLTIITLVLLVVLIGYGIWWFIYASHYEETDDAYVAGNVVQVTPQIGGTVVAINIDDTERVTAGTSL